MGWLLLFHAEEILGMYISLLLTPWVKEYPIRRIQRTEGQLYDAVKFAFGVHLNKHHT